MRRFRFRLDPLLRLRSQLERASRRELARATAALHEVDQQLVAAAHGRREFSEAAARGGLGETLASALAAGLSRHEFQLLTRQRQMAAQLETVRADYVQKKRELGALEQWREREHEEWRVDSQRTEQAELDELAQLIREGKK